MSMTSISMGISKEAKDFLNNHEYKVIGKYIANQDMYNDEYGNIYEVILYSIRYDEDDPRYQCQPIDDITTYAEVFQTTKFQDGNTAYDYFCLRDISTGKLYYEWKSEDMIWGND